MYKQLKPSATQMAPEFYGLSLQILKIIKNTVNKTIAKIKAKYSASTALIFAAFAVCKIFAAFAVCETPAICIIFAPKSPFFTPLAFFFAFLGLEYAFFAPKAFFFVCAIACAKTFFSVVPFCSMALYKLL